jgi:PAS domain S-box-containing protein
MAASNFNPAKIGEIFPHMENILQCGAYSIDLKDNTSEWSEGMFDILGVKSENYPYDPDTIYSFVHPDDKDKVQNAINESIAAKKPYQIEFALTDAMGRKKYVLAKNYIKLDEQGNLEGYTGILKDITERYMYNKERETKIDLLNKSNANLQEFVYIASHDLQEPLRKISTFIERFNDKYAGGLDSDARMYIDKIQKSSANMQALIDDLLHFSRLSITDGEAQRFSLKTIIDTVVQDLELKMEESKAVVDCDDMPDILGCPTQMRQLFSNLIGNAIKFRHPGAQPEIHIRCEDLKPAEFPDLELQPGTSYVRVIVSDNGIGFEPEYAQQIFKIFLRLHGRSEYSGSGVGLAICQKIVENHKGFIFAEATPGKGASFSVILPKI